MRGVSSHTYPGGQAPAGGFSGVEMSEYYSDGKTVILAGKLADPEQAEARTPQLAARIALALSLVDRASDAELAILAETGVMAAMLKAYRQEHDRLVTEMAETAGCDAASALRPAMAAA